MNPRPTGARPLVVIPARFSASASALRYRAEVSAAKLVQAVYDAGGEPLVLHPEVPTGIDDDDLDALVRDRIWLADGILLPGGGDLSAHWAGQPSHETLYDVDETQDAFDLLDLPENATGAQVEEKFAAFSQRFAPWTLGPDLEPMQEKARELFAAGVRAYAELTDAEQRNTLLFRRKSLRDERGQKMTGQFTIKTDLLDPEVQYRKARGLIDAGKFRDAVQYLEFASDCDPQNGLYSAELAYTRFLASPFASNRSLKELQETLRRDPECGLAAYYSGEIHRHQGNRDDAEAHFRRAIKMMHPDRRPIEALKALSSEKR